MNYLTTTGAIPEPYLTTTTGKGREGNKEGKGREDRVETSHHGVQFLTREPVDGMMR